MSILKKLKRGKDRRPALVLLYGENGEGKTTLAASAPSPIVLDLEKGAGEVGVDRIEPESLGEVLEALEELAGGGHEFETVVLDTLDQLERLGREAVRARTGWSQADFDSYGRGVKIVAADLDAVWAAIEKVRAAGLNVLILAHAALRKEREADAEQETDRWSLRCSPAVGNLFRERCDAVWFLRREKHTKKVQGSNRKTAVMTGKHILYTSPSAVAYAKDRMGLPSEIEIPLGGWSVVSEAIDATAQDISAEDVETMINRLPENVREPTRLWLSTQNDKQRAYRLLKEKTSHA